MRRIWRHYMNYEIKKMPVEYGELPRYIYSVKFVHCRWNKSKQVRLYTVGPLEWWGSFVKARQRFGYDTDEIFIGDGEFGVTIYNKKGPYID